jgi:hypothetical protein
LVSLCLQACCFHRRSTHDPPCVLLSCPCLSCLSCLILMAFCRANGFGPTFYAEKVTAIKSAMKVTSPLLTFTHLFHIVVPSIHDGFTCSDFIILVFFCSFAHFWWCFGSIFCRLSGHPYPLVLLFVSVFNSASTSLIEWQSSIKHTHNPYLTVAVTLT